MSLQLSKPEREKQLVVRLREVHKKGGTLNDLARMYSDLAEDSEEFGKIKQEISQAITNVRSAAKKACEKAGLPVERVDAMIPSFRGNRTTTNKAAREELFAYLLETTEETEESEESTETVE